MFFESLGIEPIHEKEYLRRRQKRKEKGKFVFSYIDYIYNDKTICHVDFDEQYKKYFDNTTDEHETEKS